MILGDSKVKIFSLKRKKTKIKDDKNQIGIKKNQAHSRGGRYSHLKKALGKA